MTATHYKSKIASNYKRVMYKNIEESLFFQYQHHSLNIKLK
jgi:hypothetical protein